LPTSADLLLDTSAAIPLLTMSHTAHDVVRAAVRGLTLGLAGHAAIETYSVLTRLPGSDRLDASGAERVIGASFPASVVLSVEAGRRSIAVLSAAGIAGGSVYDGLVALAARETGVPLLTRDRRAAAAYTALGVEFRLA
jgi:predicted nucleic acid-binding protein